MTQKTDKQVCLGVITSAHGIRGEIKIKPFTENLDGPSVYGRLWDKTGTHSFDILSSRVSGNSLVVRLKGVGDRNAAEALKGVKLYIDRDNLPEPENENWYFADLIGLAVYDQQDRDLGRVTAIHNFGAGDMLEITPSHGVSDLLPFTRKDVPEIDVAGGRITIFAPDDFFAASKKKNGDA